MASRKQPWPIALFRVGNNGGPSINKAEEIFVLDLKFVRANLQDIRDLSGQICKTSGK